jgi:magnesium transporter
VFEKRNPPIGSRPGTLAIPEGSPPPRIYLLDYDASGFREQEIGDPEQLRPFLETASVTWIDVKGLGDERVLRRIAELCQLHPLALEDAVNAPQRAKSELYDAHQLVIARLPRFDGEAAMGVPQVCLLIGRRHLLTFQEDAFGFFDPVRERCRAGIGSIRRLGPDYLAYALIDTLVDRYYPIAERLAQELEEIEEEILEDPTPECLTRLHRVRRQLVVLRRIGWPQREMIATMTRDPSPFVSDEVRTYLRDTDDHISQIMELLDSSREMAVGLTEIYLSNLGHRTNEIMKVLTLMASIFIPLTFIAGIYGMNFEFMPELHLPRAYPIVLLAMAALAVAMVLYFRHRGWIGGARRRKSRRDRP